MRQVDITTDDALLRRNLERIPLDQDAALSIEMAFLPRPKLERAKARDADVLIFPEAGDVAHDDEGWQLRFFAGDGPDPDAPALVLVTHHVEEIPPGFSHCAILPTDWSICCGRPSRPRSSPNSTRTSATTWRTTTTSTTRAR